MAVDFDVIVIGIGGIGSATVFHCASKRLDVLGLEQYDIPNTMGSSGGESRIFRTAQYENPAYVPLAQRAFTLWQDLEDRTGRTLLEITGGLGAGQPDSTIVQGAITSCEQHNLTHQVLSAYDVNTRFPGYSLPENHQAVYHPDAGYLRPDQCTIAHVEAAQDMGATIRAREQVEDIEVQPDERVRVTTRKDRYEAEKVIVTAGAWMGDLLPELDEVITPERQVLAWLQPVKPAQFTPEQFPVFVHGTDEGHYYGFPQCDNPGFKIGKFNHLQEAVHPDEMSRDPRPHDEDILRGYAEHYFPDGAGPTMRLKTCLFSNTPDEHFILDSHPTHPQITLGAGFSGHGFKFASAIGELLVDLATVAETTHDINLFRLDRFDL